MPKRKKLEVIPTAGLAAVPRADMDPVRQINRRGRRLRVIAWSTIILVIPTLALAMIGAVRTSGLIDKVDGLSKSVAGNGSRGVAQVALTQWLATAPSAKDLTAMAWEGSEVAATTADKTNPERTATLEIHSFMVVSKTHQQYHAEVTVAIDSRGGAVAIGTPSLVPVSNPIGDGWETEAADGGLGTGASNANIEAAANRWLDAYTSTDPDTLRLATGDPDPAHVYAPIGRRRGEMQVDRVLTPDDTDPSVIIARVHFEVFAETPESTTNDTTTTTTSPVSGDKPSGLWLTMDLRVDRANTGSPTVTAWGAVGRGAKLAAYSNATTGDRPAPTTPKTDPTTTTTKNPAKTTTTKAPTATTKNQPAKTTVKGG